MKRVILNLSPILIVPDDADPIRLAREITTAIHGMDNVQTVLIARSKVEPAPEGTCRVGSHVFYAPSHYFPPDQLMPSICPDHARIEVDDAVLAFHKPLFDDVTRLTGLRARIWHSGGGTMTIIIPLRETDPDHDWAPPCYMGLEEGHEEDGRWYGSVGFYATHEQIEDGDEVTIVAAWDEPQHPQEWARQISAHYQTLTAGGENPAE